MSDYEFGNLDDELIKKLNGEASPEPVPAEIENCGDCYQLKSINTKSKMKMLVIPLTDWRTGERKNNELDISFSVDNENSSILSSFDIRALSLPQNVTTKEFMEIFEEKYGKRWEELDCLLLSADEIFEKLFPEVVEARKKVDDIDRARILAQHGIK